MSAIVWRKVGLIDPLWLRVYLGRDPIGHTSASYAMRFVTRHGARAFVLEEAG